MKITRENNKPIEQFEFKQVGGKDSYGKANKISPALTDESLMTFGKHKGTQMINVPDTYLLWLFEQEWLKKDHPLVYAYIYNSYEAIKD